MADKDDIIASHVAGTLPELFADYMRRYHSDDFDKYFYENLVALHNSGAIDLLEVARTIDQSPISQFDFFIVQSIFVNVIPELDAEVPTMLAAVKALVARAGEDGASGAPNVAYRSWAETGDRALETLAAIDLHRPDDAVYAVFCLQALAKKEPETALDRALDLLAGSPPHGRSAAAMAIGTLPFPTAEARTRAANALEAARKSGSDDNLLGHILTAICEISRAAPEMEPSALALIVAATAATGEQAIHQVSLELMFHVTDFSPTITAALTEIVHKAAIQNVRTLKNIDHAARTLIQAGRIDEGMALITPLISAHRTLASLELFGSTSHALLNIGGNRLAGIIAGWLLMPDANLGRAANSLVGNYQGSPLLLNFDAGSLALSDVDAILLAHRAVGYLFIHPITAASLVLELIRLAEPKPRQVMAEILFDPLLINYSGELAEWLKTKVENENDVARPVIVELLRRLEAYVEGLRKAGWIKELRPSERERLIETHRQHESMRQVRKEAEKRSVLMSLVNRSVLLYGNRSISYFDGPEGEVQRSEMKLQSMSHSFETPRLDILEPFDLDYKLRDFRAMRVAR